MEIDEILNAAVGRRILVIGDVMLDHYVWGDSNRISPEAPVPVVDVFRDTYAAGGAANVALNLSAMRATPLLFGTLGDDPAGEQLTEILTSKNVSVRDLMMDSGCQTIRKTRVMVRGQQLCRVDREDAASCYAFDGFALKKKLCAALDEKVEAILISDYGKGGITDEWVAFLLEQARQRDIPLALDPKPRRKLKFEKVDLLTPNRSEAVELAGLQLSPGEDFPDNEICRILWDRYHTHQLAVTLGADGILLAERGKNLGRIPTFAREVYDVSGAGDTVIASLLLATLSGATFKEAGHFANLTAGIVVGRVGTTTATPEEVLLEAKRVRP